MIATLGSLRAVLRLAAASGLYSVREVKPHVFVWVPEDVLDQDGDPQYRRAGTAGFIVWAEGVAVIGTTNSPFHARELLYEIRKRTDAPVRYVIDTNPSGDQMLGNEVFVDFQPSILATSVAQATLQQYQRETEKRREEDWRLQARLRGYHITPPTQAFSAEMQLAGQDVKLLALGTGDSAGDAAVHLPSAKVLFLGDAFQNQYFPNPGSRDLRLWIETLRRLETWDVDTYVPGHGEPGGKKELAEFRQFLEWVVREVETRAQGGQSLEQVKQQLVPLSGRSWHAPEEAAPLVEAAYHQLSARPSDSASHPSPGRE